jgi:myo-inositol-1(or 4)-monophosphatase
MSVSVAATIDGVTVAGAVTDVLRTETFSACLGGGARRDGEAISIRTTTELASSLVGTGFAYDAVRRRQQARIVAELLPVSRDIRCVGSAALNLCWVGCGRLDAYFEQYTKQYDYATGALIAFEAGAVVELPAENELDLVMAAPASIFGSLRALVDSA